MKRIDLNCDLGEGAGHDAELMPLITSANIACGGHAGDTGTMRATVALARKYGVGIGAHPGFADPAQFGRREVPISAVDAEELVVTQIRTLQEIARAMGTEVRHVKLHGALYNMAARNPDLAGATVRAVRRAIHPAILLVLAGSVLEKIARGFADLHVVSEVFADRTYQSDGSLTPRTRRDALIDDEEAAVAQVLRMVREGVVRATEGADVAITAETVCLHGDGPHAVAFARRLRAELGAAGVEIRAFAT